MTPTVVEMVQDAAINADIDVDTLLNRRRAAPVRADLYRRLQKRGWSYSRIGREFERHHTTIMHALGAL